MKSARFAVAFMGLITALFAANAITSPPSENGQATESQPAVAPAETPAASPTAASAGQSDGKTSDDEGIPTPSIVPKSWELKFTYETPRPIMVKPPGEDKERLFWYMAYRVTNNSGDDRMFVPIFTLYTNTGQMITADQNCPSTVFDTVKKLLNNPLLKDTTSITGKILQGRDNSKDGVAIWPDFDPKAGSFDIFVGGLSGETVEKKLPVTIPNTKPPLPTTGPAAVAIRPADVASRPANVTTTLLAKTLNLRYLISSDASNRISTPLTFLREQWVMR